MEKRVLLAVTLSFIVLVAYQALVPKPKVAPRTAQSGQAQSGQTGAAQTGDAGAAGTSGAGQASGANATPALEGGAAAAAAAPAPAALVADAAERDIVVETTHVRATFSTRGAVLKSWVLKHYLERDGKPIDIIPSQPASVASKPFAISAQADDALTARLQQALYKPSADTLQLGSDPGSITFEYKDANGLAVTKTFNFQPDGKPYLLRFTVNSSLGGTPFKPTIHGGAGIGDLERAVKATSMFAFTSYQLPQAIVQRGRDVQRIPFAKVGASPVHEGVFDYAGIDDHYFLGALLPPDGVNTRVQYSPVHINTPNGPRELVDYRVRVGGEPRTLDFFYGPKDFDILATTDRELVRAIHFGMFSFLAVPLLRALKWLNAFIGNYGWSIVILTVLINLVMFPLRHKSVVSMRKMQDIQPQVKAIQDRYAKLKVTDPARQKMNTELMNLYREKGVNPASGCFPMLLTMPVLLAFYALLSVAIELRGAPFAFWIHDLSTNDPLYVTPILMGASQFWQTKMQPMAGDPAQQRMMMFMPLMFMVFFLWMPSGLVLYWLVSNVWTIGQQYVTGRLIGRSKPTVGTTAAAKRVKRAEDV